MSFHHGQKRTADNFPSADFMIDYAPSIIEAPRVLRRHHHRRRNIATATWGVEPPPAPSTLSIPHSRPPVQLRPQPFNIYKSLLRHPHLFFQFCIRLPYPSIIALYAVDKEFHYRLNKYSVGLIHEYARYHAPIAAPVFSWILYPELCISDPMLRPMDEREWLARDVPGFRWVGMVLWRQRVVREILTCLAREGHRVPRKAFEVLCKFWCVMESKSTALREAYLQDERIWSDEEVLVLQLVLVKLDMRFSDPVLGNGIAMLSHLLLTQKGLQLLWKVLTGREELDYDSVTEILVRTYLSEDLDTEAHTWLADETENGVPEEEWGLLCREGWHVDGKRMESAVDMVIMEGIRRGLDVQKYYLDFVLYGFVDGDGHNIPVPRPSRQRNKADMVEFGWPTEHERQAALKSLRELAGRLRAGEMEVDG